MLFLAQEYATDFDSASSTARNLNFAVYLVRVEDPLLLQFHHHGTGYSPLCVQSFHSLPLIYRLGPIRIRIVHT